MSFQSKDSKELSFKKFNEKSGKETWNLRSLKDQQEMGDFIRKARNQSYIDHNDGYDDEVSYNSPKRKHTRNNLNNVTDKVMLIKKKKSQKLEEQNLKKNNIGMLIVRDVKNAHKSLGGGF